MKANTLLCATLLAVTTPSFATELYDIKDIGAIYPLTDEEYQELKVHMNDSGKVVGWSRISPGNPVIKAFIWDEAAPAMERQYLNTNLTVSDAAISINNSNIVGGWASPSGVRLPYYWKKNVIGTWTPWPITLPADGTQGEIHTISNSGIFGVNYRDATLTEHGHVWTEAGLADAVLNPLLRNAHISQITENNFVIGEFTNPLGETHAYVMETNPTPITTDLGFLGTVTTNYSHVHTMNLAGTTVGGADTDPTFCDAATPPNCYGIKKAIQWDAINGMQELIPIDVASSWANGINEAGDIVGWRVENNKSSALLWQAGIVLDLNKLINPASLVNPDLTVNKWDLKRADAINASGRIVGSGIKNGANHLFMLVPSGVVATAADLAIAIVTPAVAGKMTNREKVTANFDPIQIQVTNHGPDVASDVVVFGSVPYDINMDHIKVENGTCFQEKELELSCKFDQIAVGETINIDVNLAQAIPANYILTFIVRSTDSSIIDTGGVPNNMQTYSIKLPETFGNGTGGRTGNPAYPDGSSGIGGCTLSTGNKAIDPLFYLMILGSAFYLYRRRQR